jgi:hypothetical protein
VAMHWTWRFQNDPGHRWLREVSAGMRFEEVAKSSANAARASSARRRA